jgi:hypothetical protein
MKMNKDKKYPGDSWSDPMIEFGRKLGYTDEELAAKDNAFTVANAFAEHLGITLEQYAEWADDSTKEHYGLTARELHDRSVELSRTGRYLALSPDGRVVVKG